jgi:hypothetical protein
MAVTEFTATSAGIDYNDAIWVSRTNQYWFAMSIDSGGGAPTVRYASTLGGTWSTASIPQPSGSYTIQYGTPTRHGVVYGLGVYAFVVSYRDSGTTGTETWVIRATNPSGTWTASRVTTSNNLLVNDMIFVNGALVCVGRGVTSNNPFSAYSYNPTTWTLYNTLARTGYDPTQDYRIESMGWDGVRYMTVATGPGGTDTARFGVNYYTQTWSTPTNFPTGLGTMKSLKFHKYAGIWTISDQLNTNYYWTYGGGATAPNTWYQLDSSSTGMADASMDLAYGKGYWIASGNVLNGSFNDVPRLAYLYSPSGSPVGTYTEITQDGFPDRPDSSMRAWSINYHNSRFITATSGYGDVAYSVAESPPIGAIDPIPFAWSAGF